MAPISKQSKQKKAPVVKSKLVKRRRLPRVLLVSIHRPIPSTKRKMLSLQLAPESMERAQSILSSGDTQEHGGALILDANGTMHLQETKTNARGSDYINLPLDMFMWHTHPQKCEQKASCGLGMPSSSDIERFIIDAMRSPCYAHLVFAHEGTYVLALKPSTRRLLAAKSASEQAAYAKQIAERFADIQKRFQENFESVGYERFRKEWMQFANQQSIDVVFFGKSKLPRFKIAP